jgi:branched-chain amino acid transport system permease protein
LDQITIQSQIVQYFLTGCTIGAIYALVAIGFNIIYNVTEVINFAQGEFAVGGGLAMVLAVNTLYFPLWLGLLFSVALVSLVGALLYLLTIRPLKKPTILTMIMVTIAGSIILKGLAMFGWGKDPYALPSFTSGPPIKFWGASLMPQSFWVIGILAFLVLLLSYFFGRTVIGKAMRACADNPLAAGLVGIGVFKMVLLSFVLSAALGAVGGAIITPITLMEYDRGAMLALKGFGAAILGGLGSFGGAVVAGLTLGLLESYVTGFVSASYKDAVALLVLLTVLFIRPSGLWGSRHKIGVRH